MLVHALVVVAVLVRALEVVTNQALLLHVGMQAFPELVKLRNKLGILCSTATQHLGLSYNFGCFRTSIINKIGNGECLLLLQAMPMWALLKGFRHQPHN